MNFKSVSNIETITAECGCTFQGRFYSASGCTVMDLTKASGHDVMRHCMAAERKAKRLLARTARTAA